jgi:hypothetical protein
MKAGVSGAKKPHIASKSLAEKITGWHQHFWRNRNCSKEDGRAKLYRKAKEAKEKRNSLIELSLKISCEMAGGGHRRKIRRSGQRASAKAKIALYLWRKRLINIGEVSKNIIEKRANQA